MMLFQEEGEANERVANYKLTSITARLNRHIKHQARVSALAGAMLSTALQSTGRDRRTSLRDYRLWAEQTAATQKLADARVTRPPCRRHAMARGPGPRSGALSMTAGAVFRHRGSKLAIAWRACQCDKRAEARDANAGAFGSSSSSSSLSSQVQAQQQQQQQQQEQQEQQATESLGENQTKTPETREERKQRHVQLMRRKKERARALRRAARDAQQAVKGQLLVTLRNVGAGGLEQLQEGGRAHREREQQQQQQPSPQQPLQQRGTHVQQVALSKVVRESVVNVAFWRRATGMLPPHGLEHAGAAAARRKQRVLSASRPAAGPPCTCDEQGGGRRGRRRPQSAAAAVSVAYGRGGYRALEMRRALPPKERQPMPRQRVRRREGRLAPQCGDVSMDMSAKLQMHMATVGGGDSRSSSRPVSLAASPRRLLRSSSPVM